MSEQKEDLLAQMRDPVTKKLKCLSADDFLKCWKSFDKDGSGYLEGNELDAFLREMVKSVTPADTNDGVLSESALSVLKEDLLLAYDENEDGKIDMLEMANILPLEETFKALFSEENQLPSSVEFIQLWHKFDQDNSGHLEMEELKLFLQELFQRRDITLQPSKLDEYTDTIMKLFDTDQDGKLKISEISKLLPVKQNFLKRPLFKVQDQLTNGDIDRAFLNYDKDGSGYLEGDELEGFLKDLMEVVKMDYDEESLKAMQHAIMSEWDKDSDGKLGREELKAIIMHSVNMCQNLLLE